MTLRILGAAGCRGEMIHAKLDAVEIPPDKPPLLAFHGHDYTGGAPPIVFDFARMIGRLREAGYYTTLILCVRNPYAQIRSAVALGHWPSPEVALRESQNWYSALMLACAAHSVPFLIAPYESFTYEGWFAVNHWLSLLDLGPVEDDRQFELMLKNGKHYYS